MKLRHLIALFFALQTSLAAGAPGQNQATKRTNVALKPWQYAALQRDTKQDLVEFTLNNNEGMRFNYEYRLHEKVGLDLGVEWLSGGPGLAVLKRDTSAGAKKSERAQQVPTHVGIAPGVAFYPVTGRHSLHTDFRLAFRRVDYGVVFERLGSDLPGREEVTTATNTVVPGFEVGYRLQPKSNISIGITASYYLRQIKLADPKPVQTFLLTDDQYQTATGHLQEQYNSRRVGIAGGIGFSFDNG